MTAAASLKNVSLRYGSRWALIRMTADLPAGKTTLVTGPNGAGKTTLLRVLSTAMSPTRGELELFGIPTKKNPDAVRPRISLVTHANHLYEDLSAEENLRMIARLTGRDEGKSAAILDRVGLGPHAHRNPRIFSAGMKRRLCIGRMLMREPDLALLDEPFGRLDPAGVSLVEDIMDELRAQGVTIVVSTHDLPRGERIADVHLELESGKIKRFDG